MTPVPKTPRRSRNLDRDQKLQVLTLYNARHGPKYISERLGITVHQVKYTIAKGEASPKKNKGRPPKLTPAQVDQIEEFVCSSRENRRMSYLEIAFNFSEWNVGECAVKNALEKRGYKRNLNRQKPVASREEKNTPSTWSELHRH